MGTSDEMKELLSKGTFLSFENCVYLAGACNVGKSTLASILIGEDIPKEWNSTDGLNIYFGRNGIDLETGKMVPLELNQGNTSKHLVNILQNGQKSLKISYCYKKKNHSFFYTVLYVLSLLLTVTLSHYLIGCLTLYGLKNGL
jgi:hypothetical protein